MLFWSFQLERLHYLTALNLQIPQEFDHFAIQTVLSQDWPCLVKSVGLLYTQIINHGSHFPPTDTANTLTLFKPRNRTFCWVDKDKRRGASFAVEHHLNARQTLVSVYWTGYKTNNLLLMAAIL